MDRLGIVPFPGDEVAGPVRGRRRRETGIDALRGKIDLGLQLHGVAGHGCKLFGCGGRRLSGGGLYSGRAALRAPDREDGWRGYGRDIWQAALLLIELERYGPTPCVDVQF